MALGGGNEWSNWAGSRHIWPLYDPDDGSAEETRLALIRERLTSHCRGLPVVMDLLDFRAHAADDIEYLLSRLDEADEEQGRVEREREEERQSYFDQAREDIEAASKLVGELESEMNSATRAFKRTREHLDRLKSHDDVQLANLRHELKAAHQLRRDVQFQLDSTLTERDRLKQEVDTLKAKLDGLPPTWLERVQGT